jgi:Trk-type K+ transport system membrane component
MLETLNLSTSTIILGVISFIILVLAEIWLIRQIVQSKLVKSKKERVLWIIFAILNWVVALLVFNFVTNQRHREKYSKNKN